MSDHSIYDSDYYLRGKETGKSLYENYRWLPELTLPMAERIVQHCGIKRRHKILDFGCARGYLVKALRQLEYQAFGFDVSKWALDNADEEVKQYLNQDVGGEEFLKYSRFDWVIAKDVLEHCEFVHNVIRDLMSVAQVGVFVVVPLSHFPGGRYVIEEYEKDVTHKQHFTLPGWARMFMEVGWSVEVSYRVRGIKDNYYKPGMELGNGFITARRVEE